MTVERFNTDCPYRNIRVYLGTIKTSEKGMSQGRKGLLCK